MGHGDPGAVEAPGAIGVAHQGVFDAVGFLLGVVAVNDGDELVGVAQAGQDAFGDLTAASITAEAVEGAHTWVAALTHADGVE